MLFRLKAEAEVHQAGAEWLVHARDYEAEWAPGWPRDPREVRLFRGSDRKEYVDVPMVLLDRRD